jgi:hypothetical protein
MVISMNSSTLLRFSAAALAAVLILLLGLTRAEWLAQRKWVLFGIGILLIGIVAVVVITWAVERNKSIEE